LSKSAPKKTRLDVLLVQRGLAESRHKAQALILAGEVLVNGQKAGKAGTLLAEDDRVELAGRGVRFVSRGGLKLEGALQDLQIDPAGCICADVGSSTGGFTDCLLQHGARKVYAIDVSPQELAWKLRRDARVVSIQCNARNLSAGALPEPAGLVTVDLSFISTAKVLEAVARIAAPGAHFLILVKPQFELERAEVGRGGIVADAKLQRKATNHVEEAARACGLQVVRVAASRVTGAEGNQEFFLHARKPLPGNA
jgi:23S rRNA (cytidine1920-2'-O)/16S rRNA (cytidine1409-2'-O)-methyltransferase